MAYENRNAAYDLSLFDDSSDYVPGSAAPERKEEVHKKQERKRRKNNVVSLPKEELQKNRRRRHNKFKIALGTVSGAAATIIIGIIIVGQVRLTELNQEVITAKETLANAQSVYTQTQMKLESKLSTSDIEKYAEDTLGMTKATNTQKEFVTLAGGKRIKEKRIEKGFTQEQLGELCELSAAHIGHIERGTRILSVDVLFRISQALDTSIDWLVFDSVENKHMLNEINSVLKDTDKTKVTTFLNTVRVLADNIDKL